MLRRNSLCQKFEFGKQIESSAAKTGRSSEAEAGISQVKGLFTGTSAFKRLDVSGCINVFKWIFR